MLLQRQDLAVINGERLVTNPDLLQLCSFNPVPGLGLDSGLIPNPTCGKFYGKIYPDVAKVTSFVLSSGQGLFLFPKSVPSRTQGSQLYQHCFVVCGLDMWSPRLGGALQMPACSLRPLRHPTDIISTGCPIGPHSWLSIPLPCPSTMLWLHDSSVQPMCSPFLQCLADSSFLLSFFPLCVYAHCPVSLYPSRVAKMERRDFSHSASCK